MDITVEMAALGLPSSFVARSDAASTKKIRKKLGSPKPTSQDLLSGHSSGIRADGTPTASLDENGSPQVSKFCIRICRLYTAAEFEVQTVANDVDGPTDVGAEAILDNATLGNCLNMSSTQHDFITMANDEPSTAPPDPGRLDHSNVKLSVIDEVATGKTDPEGIWVPVWDDEYQCYYYFNRQTSESTWEVPVDFGHFETNFLTGLGNESSHAVGTPAAFEDTFTLGDDKYEMVETKTSSNVGTSSALHTSSGAGFERDMTSLFKQATVLESISNLRNGSGGTNGQGTLEQTLDSNFQEAEAVQDDDDMPLAALPNSHVRFQDNSSSRSCDGDDITSINWDEMSTASSATLLYQVNEEEIGSRTSLPDCGVAAIQDEVASCRSQLKVTRTRRSRASLGQSEKSSLISKRVVKYWLQRYSLFGKFDQGIKLDEEGWYSVTPEVIAQHHAGRCASGLVIDAFTGVGGNAIQLALTCNWVIAIDINPVRVEYARHNAEIYGVAHKIEFIVGDFLKLAPFLKADVVFLSPPWGGPEYLQQDVYDLCSMLQPTDGITLFKAAQTIALNIALFVPRNVNLSQLQELSWLSSPPLPCEAEKNFVNGKLKAVTAYYGDIARIVFGSFAAGCKEGSLTAKWKGVTFTTSRKSIYTA